MRALRTVTVAPALSHASSRIDDAAIVRFGSRIDCHYDLFSGGAKSQLESVAPFFMRSRDGQRGYEGIPSPSYPECRRLWWGFAEELMTTYEPDGLFVSFRTHATHPDGRGSDWAPFVPNSYGFDAPAVECYRRRTGQDPLSEELHLEAWSRVQGRFRTLLLAEVRAAVGPGQLSAPTAVDPGLVRRPCLEGAGRLAAGMSGPIPRRPFGQGAGFGPSPAPRYSRGRWTRFR